MILLLLLLLLPPSTTTTTTTTNSSLVEPDLYDEMFRLDKRLEMYRRGWGLGHMSGSAHPDTSVVVRFCFLICLFFFFHTFSQQQYQRKQQQTQILGTWRLTLFYLT